MENETICSPIDRNKIRLDSGGFWFLIRTDFERGGIEVAACCREKGNPPKYIVETFFGRCAQDIYHKILEERMYVKSLTHAAYLGKELKKAEIALVIGLNFYQE